MGPSSSSSSSIRATSDTVHARQRGRARARSSSGRRGDPARLFASASTSGLAYRRPSRVVADVGIHARLIALRASTESRISASHALFSSLPTRPSESAPPASLARRTASTSMSSRAKPSRAMLWGRPERFAWRLARSTSERRTRRFHTRSSWSRSGSRARRRTASRRIPAQAGRPLRRARAGSSTAVALTPGTSDPMVLDTTPVSPREGRTASM